MPTARPFWKNPIFITAIICMVVFLAVMVFTSGGGGTRTASVKSMTAARKICLACRQYSREHGAFPPSFDALFPTYLPDRSALVSPLNGAEPIGYTYTPPAPDRIDSPDTIVIEDKFAPTLTHSRIVSYANGSARILSIP